MWLERVSGITPDLIDLADAKSHLRLIEGDFDTEVARAISAACAYLDVDHDGAGRLSSPLVSQVWAWIGKPVAGRVVFPFLRVRSVVSVTYKDASGADQTIPAEKWMVIKEGRQHVLCAAPGGSWPTLQVRSDAMRVEFEAGWTDVDSVPEDIKHACRLLVGHFFQNRSNEYAGQPSQSLQLGVESLIRRYRRAIL